MSYRPQFAFRPSPCYEQKCLYSFDYTNVPFLYGNSLLGGTQTGRIPLHLDKDSAFELRAVSFSCPNDLLAFRLEDPSGNALCDSENAQVLNNFVLPNEAANPNGAGAVALEGGPGGIPSPPSANYVLYLYRLPGALVLTSDVAINLHGVKLYREEACQ